MTYPRKNTRFNILKVIFTCMRILVILLICSLSIAFQQAETATRKAAACYLHVNEALKKDKLLSHEYIGLTHCGGRLKGYYFPNDTNYCLLIDRNCGECACTQTETYYMNGKVVFVLRQKKTHTKTQEYCPGYTKGEDERFWFSNGMVVRYQLGSKVFTGDTLRYINNVYAEEQCVNERIADLPSLKR